MVPLQFHTGVHEYQISLYNKCVCIKNAHIP
nr:MAG TPA: hypothetical protein [Caudoviricetes sp.]DAF75373.1 MAG TPA: hypothetical protein [Caudoviricetes sp.]